MNLIDYGLIPENFLAPDGQQGDNACVAARVTAVYRERYELVCESGKTFGRLKNSVYYANSKENFPTTGDFVLIHWNATGDSQIIKTLPRKSFFSRRSPTPGRGEQAVAANFDYVFIIQSLNLDFNPKRMERYLTLAWQSGALPVIILSKADLADDYAAQVRAMSKVVGSVPVFAVSAQTGFGIDALSEYLQPRKTIVLLGSSGVGKSSLVNKLAGKAVMPTNEIREDDSKGRHTTTHRQLIMLPNGVMLIDTPGMRELGMWDVSTWLDEAFGDVEQYFGKCKFSDCKHQTEPGCAVRAAIAAGELSPQRWESYVALKKEAGRSGKSQINRKQSKEIAKLQKQMRQPDYRHTPCPESFPCKVCGSLVVPEGAGSQHRNHCPNCLCSLHVDNKPGDRASLCGGIMEPIGVWVRKNGEWAIIHRCRSCGALHANRVAADDNPALLLSIAVRPLAEPPFPLGRLEQSFRNPDAL